MLTMNFGYVWSIVWSIWLLYRECELSWRQIMVTFLFFELCRDVNGREFARIGQGVLFLGSFVRGSFLPRNKTPARKTSCPTEKNLPGSGRKLREFFFLGTYSGSLRELLREFYSWYFFPWGSFARINNKPLARLRESIRNISRACANQPFACSLICANPFAHLHELTCTFSRVCANPSRAFARYFSRVCANQNVTIRAFARIWFQHIRAFARKKFTKTTAFAQLNQ